MKGLLLDTNIFIDALRGHSAASEYLKTLEDNDRVISVISVGELYSGVRSTAERIKLEWLLGAYQKRVVDEPIAAQAGLFRQQYRASHGLDLMDALIAATAHHHGLALVTRNRKHFPMLPDVRTPY